MPQGIVATSRIVFYIPADQQLASLSSRTRVDRLQDRPHILDGCRKSRESANDHDSPVLRNNHKEQAAQHCNLYSGHGNLPSDIFRITAVVEWDHYCVNQPQVCCSRASHAPACMQGTKLRYYLKDHSQSSFGLCLDWCLSTAPNAVSSDAVWIRQGLFDKAAVFEDFEGNHMMTMQQSWGTDNMIAWKLNTYR